MAELQIPIKLQIENLQSLIGDLQSKLSNLKVGSAGFKSLQNLIKSMKNELDKLQIQGSKPFVDASQFTRAEHSVDKLEEQLQKAEMTLGRLKFSDLELSPNQKADLQAFEDQINAEPSIQIEYSNAQPEIIRCADCKHVRKWRSEESAKKFGQVYGCARGVLRCPEPGDFCSYAKRRAYGTD